MDPLGCELYEAIAVALGEHSAPQSVLGFQHSHSVGGSGDVISKCSVVAK